MAGRGGTNARFLVSRGPRSLGWWDKVGLGSASPADVGQSVSGFPPGAWWIAVQGAPRAQQLGPGHPGVPPAEQRRRAGPWSTLWAVPAASATLGLPAGSAAARPAARHFPLLLTVTLFLWFLPAPGSPPHPGRTSLPPRASYIISAARLGSEVLDAEGTSRVAQGGKLTAAFWPLGAKGQVCSQRGRPLSVRLFEFLASRAGEHGCAPPGEE